MQRRLFLQMALLGWPSASMLAATGGGDRQRLLDIPLEIAGDWRGSAPRDAAAVVTRMREACLGHMAMRSDRQPERLRVDDQSNGYPHIWLHKDNPQTAWIVLDVGARDWCNLAYQFGHELGHVVANSWSQDAKPGGPSQWLEEALVEAFSLYGLKRLSEAWRRQPPFPNDSKYADSILEHRDRLLQPDWKLAQEQRTAAGLAEWFRGHRDVLEKQGTVETSRPAVPTFLALYDGDPRLIEDLGAMNRWSERTHLGIIPYLERWQASCAELGTPGDLPRRLQALLK